MSLLKALQDLALEQRKAAVGGTGGEHAAFLSLVLSDVNGVAKKGQREATDEDADVAVRAAIKSFEKAIAGDETADPPVPPLDLNTDFGKTVVAQRDLLGSLVPPILSRDELKMAVRDACAEADVPIEPKSMGKVMGILKVKYPNRVDGHIVKELLASGEC